MKIAAGEFQNIKKGDIQMDTYNQINDYLLKAGVKREERKRILQEFKEKIELLVQKAKEFKKVLCDEGLVISFELKAVLENIGFFFNKENNKTYLVYNN